MFDLTRAPQETVRHDSTLCLQFMEALFYLFNSFQAEDKKKREEDKKDLPPVKEDDIPSSQKDPNNSSGCVVS